MVIDAITNHLFAGLVSTGYSASITYRRNGAVIATIDQAVKGRSRTERSFSDFVETLASTDWIVRVADLGVEPEPNDRIYDGATTYKVLTDNDERCWDFVDQFDTLYRIRTVKVKR